MKSAKTMKRALGASIVAMILSIVMLSGTTLAWFTDSEVSGSNVISSGNLDIEVQYTLDGEKWADLDGATDLFQKGLWEPGHTEVVVLKVNNEGSLALKYNANMNIVNEKEGTNQANEEFKLSDYLTVSTLTIEDAGADPVLGWDIAAMTLEKAFEDEDSIGWGAPVAFNAGKILEQDMQLYSDSSHYVFVKVDMPETVDNVANHNGTDVPEIDFGVNVLATQFTHEEDTFGDQYDKDAEYDHVVGTSDELIAAFEKGGNIQLSADIALDERLNLAEGTEVYLDMNGKTITASDATVDPVFYTYKGSTLTIDGNGTVEIGEPSMSLMFPGGDVVIENGTFIRNVPAGTLAKDVGALIVGAKVSPWGSQTVTINGGYFDGGYYDANAADIEEILAGTKEFTETADDIAKRGISTDKNAVRVALKNNVQLNLNLSYNLIKVYGGTFVGFNPAWGDEGCMLPTTPNYLRPWSYYQGALLDGQTDNADGIVLPAGYSITKGSTADGRPTYTVNYSK